MVRVQKASSSRMRGSLLKEMVPEGFLSKTEGQSLGLLRSATWEGRPEAGRGRREDGLMPQDRCGNEVEPERVRLAEAPPQGTACPLRSSTQTERISEQTREV